MTLEELEGRIVSTLSPILGETMARGAVRSQIARLKLVTPLSPPDVERVVIALGSGLNVFVGKQRSGQLVEQLRTELSRANL